MPTFITGGTGYIGKQVARRVANAGGKVHLLVRKSGNLKGLSHPGIEIFFGDLRDDATIRKAMTGCQRVYHIGALVKRWHPDASEYDRVNIDGTRSVFQAAIDLKIDKLVYTSSVMAIGPSGHDPADENHRRRLRFTNDYERTKYFAEQAFYEMVAKGLLGVIVSPSLVFGPSVNFPGSITNRFIKDLIDGRLKGIPGDGEQLGNGVYIEDVVTGHLLAMDKGRLGEKYILGGENISMNRFIALVQSEFNLKKNYRKIPLAILWLAGLVNEWKARRTGSDPEFPKNLARIYASDWAYSSEKARRELGYHPRTLREGLIITYAWLTGKPLPPPPPSEPVGPRYIPITLK